MAVYRFRISFEEYDEVYRDIEIKSVQNFEQFHHAIQKAIDFDASKPASFYMSNDYWKKGQEIKTEFMTSGNDKSNGAILMKEARLCDFIADPHQKIYYVFDQPSPWTFYIELFKIFPDTEAGKVYPVCVKVHGEAPKQYLKVEPPKGVPDPEFMDDDMFNELLVDEDTEESDDETATVSEVVTGFGEAVDEEEYDSIEEPTDDETERE